MTWFGKQSRGQAWVTPQVVGRGTELSVVLRQGSSVSIRGYLRGPWLSVSSGIIYAHVHRTFASGTRVPGSVEMAIARHGRWPCSFFLLVFQSCSALGSSDLAQVDAGCWGRQGCG